MQRPRRFVLRKDPFAALAYALMRNGITTEQVDRMLSLQGEVGRLLRTYINKSSGKWNKVTGGLAVLFLWAKITSPFILS